jgi:hypothetical protein
LSFFVTLNLRKNFRVFAILTVNFVVFTSTAKNDSQTRMKKTAPLENPDTGKKGRFIAVRLFMMQFWGPGRSPVQFIFCKTTKIYMVEQIKLVRPPVL